MRCVKKYCPRKALPGKDYCQEHWGRRREAYQEEKMRYDITSARHKAKMEKLLGKDPLDLTEELALLRLIIDEDQKVALDDTNPNSAEKEAAKDKVDARLKTLMQGAKTAQQIKRNSNQLIDRDVLLAQISRFVEVIKSAIAHLPDKGDIMARIAPAIMDIAQSLRNQDETITIEAPHHAQHAQQTLEQQDDRP